MRDSEALINPLERPSPTGDNCDHKKQTDQDAFDQLFQDALRTQSSASGDGVPTAAEIHSFATTHFGDAMAAAKREFLEACDEMGPRVVINKVFSGPGDLVKVRDYFGGHTRHYRADPKGHLGSKLMSYVLQTSQTQTGNGVYGTMNTFQLTGAACLDSSRITASYPTGWGKKELVIGDIQTEEMESRVRDSFRNSEFLDLLLLLNRICDTQCSQDPTLVVLKPRTFGFDKVTSEYEATLAFKWISSIADELLQVMQPAFEFEIGHSPVLGGETDISVAVIASDELGQSQRKFRAIIELKKPSIECRAANILAFGDQPTNEDLAALRETVSPMRDEKLEKTLEQIQRFTLPVKRTVVQDDNGPVLGYTHNGEDVTSKLKESYLYGPVTSLHTGLEQGSRYGLLNGCRDVAVSDGVTVVGTHIRDVEELVPGIVTANFNSHHAVDLTEDGSSLEVLQYLVNAVFRDPRVRLFTYTLLEAAAMHFGEGGITPESAASFRAQVNRLRNYKFDSKSCPEDESLKKSAREFTKSRVPVFREALSHFKQLYGSIALNGEYESSSFNVLKYFRMNPLEGFSSASDVRVASGRSRSVSKVSLNGTGAAEGSLNFADSPEYFIFKIYDGDTASIKRMEREIKAYSRIEQLGAVDQNRFAKLLAFGALDLEDVDPRLFILTEFVENAPAGKPPYDVQEHEIDRVNDTLKSVGVYHNDLEERNFRWQLKDDEWLIKVFDFDHATFDD